MRQRMLPAVGAMVLALCSWTASAQEDAGAQEDDKFLETLPPEEQEALRDKWQSMTPEEQTDAKQKLKERRAKVDSLTPEQKEQLKEHREQNRDEWENMSDEERAAWR